jgi:hypothetical protein
MLSHLGVPAPDPPDDRPSPGFVKFCKGLTLDEQIAIVKTYRPEWTVRLIADTCGVSGRTVLRSAAYRRLREIDRARPTGQSKWRGRTRRRIEPPEERGFSNPFDPFA